MKAVGLVALATLGLSMGAMAQQTSQQLIQASDGRHRTDRISFHEADKNKDGRINRVEGAAIVEFDFSSADANDDFLLSRPEFAAAMARAASRGDGEPGARSGDRTAQVTFASMDRNKDGKIDAYEAAGIPGLNFSSADVDDNHSVSRREFQTAMASSKPRG